jgi:2-dehydro-3-deoxyphosphooctonate aldolase (KDO 8-P synthase)
MAVRKLDRWNLAIGDGQPLVVIAGLNVLEDEKLALETARQLKAICAGLRLPYIFKASFDKANRSSILSYRGPGLEDGLRILSVVKAEVDVPICTDLHTAEQAEAVAEVADVVQIPAFLGRQTDLVVAAARAAHRRGGWLHQKKSQNMAPWDAKHMIDKVREAVDGAEISVLCERGTTFGYNNLVVDMLAIPEMHKLGVPVTIDATHAVQLPGADPRTQGASTGGRRDGVAIIAKAAIAAGADGVFLEFHPNPDDALCDGPSALPLAGAGELLSTLKALHEIVSPVSAS